MRHAISTKFWIAQPCSTALSEALIGMGCFPMRETLTEGFWKERSLHFLSWVPRKAACSLLRGDEGVSGFGCCWQDHTAALKAESFQMKLTPWGRTERPKANKQTKTTESKRLRLSAEKPTHLEQLYHHHGPIDSLYCLSQSEPCFLFLQ